MVTVGLNIALAPVLIAGWGAHHPLGVAGAGLATSLSVAVGVLPALWLSQRAGFRLLDVWHLSVASVFLQAVVSLVLVWRQMGSPLAPLRVPPPATTNAAT